MDLPHNTLLYLLLLSAVAIGFLLGRRELRPARAQSEVIKDYYQGLNFLLGDRPELGVDRFIQAMEVSDETVDVHLALASVVRRRGEVDKAIRIHQNLLASPVLSTANKHLVEYELARDYHAAGLLDRAEALLVEIVHRRDAQEKAATALLIDLYEQEREWQNALNVSARLMRTDNTMRARLSHFHCELAEKHLHAAALKQALEHARAAIAMDGSGPRGHWLAAEIELRLKRYRRAMRSLHRVVELQPDLVTEVLPSYARCCEALGQDGEYLSFLQQAVERFPAATVINALLEHRHRNALEAPYEAIIEAIEGHPQAEHIPILLDARERVGEALENRIGALLKRIIRHDGSHQCRNCGFTSHTHMWHCPTCKGWGTFALEAEPTDGALH